jgi:hypothetical protein
MGLFRNNADMGIEQAQTVQYNYPRPLTAAAQLIKLNDKSEAERFKLRRNSNVTAWQADAWEYYDAIGEVKYAFNLVAAVVSRIRLYAAAVNNASEAPVPARDADEIDPDLALAAERALARLDSAFGGQAGLLKDAALNLAVTGECYLVQIPERHVNGQLIPESWDIRSVDELQINQHGQYSIAPRSDLVTSGGQMKPGVIPLPPTAFMGRIWRAHPRFSDEPDSSLKGLLDLCSELLLLNRTFRAIERSRLNAGLLYIPDGMAVAHTGDPNYPYAEGESEDEFGVPEPTPEELEDEFEDQLMDAMTTPIEDESSAAAVVPLLVRGPAELGEKIKLVKFERTYDDALIKRSERVLERILQGLDVPKDVVTGLANVKYSNAVQIDEALYKAHIEPLLLLISDALTTVYLRPYLKSIGFSEEQVKRVVVWYDPSAVATRNDRAADADSGYDKMAISVDTWRRAHGFSDADAPTPTELALRLLQSRASFTPEMTEALIAAVAPEIMQAARTASQATSVAPVPGNVQDILNGGQGATPGEVPNEAIDNADTGLTQPAGGDGTAPAPAGPGPAAPAAQEVAPEAAPIPLAEPSTEENPPV